MFLNVLLLLLGFFLEKIMDLCSPNENCFSSTFNLHFCVEKKAYIGTFIQNNNACYFALRLGVFNNQGLFTTWIYFTYS